MPAGVDHTGLDLRAAEVHAEHERVRSNGAVPRRDTHRCVDKAKQNAAGLGVGLAGQVNDSGVVRSAPNLRWDRVPLGAALTAVLALPVVVTNDVRAAAYGEWRYGDARDARDIVCVFVGTRVGAGVITEGRLLRGCANVAGELGRGVIAAAGRRCRCGNRGCLEAYVGGWAIAERAQEAVQAGRAVGQMLLSLGDDLRKISAVCECG